MRYHAHAAIRRARLGACLALLMLLGATAEAVAQQAEDGVKLEWLTWSFFRITSPEGKVILTNPWLSNPDSQTTLEAIDRADVILVPTGHGDEVGETVEVANKTGAKVVATWEMAGGAFKDKIPDEQFVRVQPGSKVDLDGITVRVVNAVHGTGGPGALYGGPALGFFITFENGYTLYFSGSTDVTMDMQLWGAMFQPDGAILYASPALDPKDVAQMVRLLSADNADLKTVIPHHHRTSSPAGRSPADVAAAIEELSLEVDFIDPKPGEVYTLTE